MGESRIDPLILHCVDPHSGGPTPPGVVTGPPLAIAQMVTPAQRRISLRIFFPTHTVCTRGRLVVLGLSLCWAISYRPQRESGSSTLRRVARMAMSSSAARCSSVIKPASVTVAGTPPGRAARATPRCTDRRWERTARCSTGPQLCGSQPRETDRSGDSGGALTSAGSTVSV
jgi:hypothetical protein